ncbi:hypothetical protein C8J57DRAFT_1256453 [Mycena rebaudengoi]|nr:hypothetical protein C8J57DRAFT_1256453 [Mycena rebaudengoi]
MNEHRITSCVISLLRYLYARPPDWRKSHEVAYPSNLALSAVESRPSVIGPRIWWRDIFALRKTFEQTASGGGLSQNVALQRKRADTTMLSANYILDTPVGSKCSRNALQSIFAYTRISIVETLAWWNLPRLGRRREGAPQPVKSFHAESVRNTRIYSFHRERVSSKIDKLLPRESLPALDEFGTVMFAIMDLTRETEERVAKHEMYAPKRLGVGWDPKALQITLGSCGVRLITSNLIFIRQLLAFRNEGTTKKGAIDGSS